MRVFVDKKATKSLQLLHSAIQTALINEKIEVRIGNALWQIEAHILKNLTGEEPRIIFWLKAPDELVEDIIVINANNGDSCRSIAVSDCLLHNGEFKPAILANLRFQAQAIALDREARLLSGGESFSNPLTNRTNPRLA